MLFVLKVARVAFTARKVGAKFLSQPSFLVNEIPQPLASPPESACPAPALQPVPGISCPIQGGSAGSAGERLNPRRGRRQQAWLHIQLEVEGQGRGLASLLSWSEIWTVRAPGALVHPPAITAAAQSSVPPPGAKCHVIGRVCGLSIELQLSQARVGRRGWKMSRSPCSPRSAR